MTPLKRFYAYSSPVHKQMAIASLYSLLNKFFDILPEVLLGVAVDIVVNRHNSLLAQWGLHHPLHQLSFLAILTFFVWGLESLFQYLYSVQWRKVSQKIQHQLRLETFSHIQKLEMHFFENQNTGNLLSILNDDINQLERFLDNGINNILQVSFSTLAVGLIFFYLAPGVAIFSFLPIPIIVLGAFYFQKHIGPKYAQVRQAVGMLAAHISGSLSGIATIKSYTAEAQETATLNQKSLAYQTANEEAILISSAFIPLIRMAIVVGFVATVWLGGKKCLDGTLAIGSYSVLVFLTQRLLWPLTELASLTDLYQRAMASVERVLDLLHEPITTHSGNRPLGVVQGEIQFKNITFAYDPAPPLFYDFNLRIPAKTTLALVGLTGSGKSTLAKLLLRFYTQQKGQILLDHHNIETLDLKDLRSQIGLVSQDVFLFHGTVLENIVYGNKNATFQDVEKASQLAEAHEFIQALPKQYDTMIGERGQKLSGGQRQRISIARAILKNPPILILDEATSAIDNETELAIQRSFAQVAKNRTTLIIAHRLSTIRHAHHIVVLHQGKILEEGTHESLLAQNGQYALLWRIQTGEVVQT